MSTEDGFSTGVTRYPAMTLCLADSYLKQQQDFPDMSDYAEEQSITIHVALAQRDELEKDVSNAINLGLSSGNDVLEVLQKRKSLVKFVLTKVFNQEVSIDINKFTAEHGCTTTAFNNRKSRLKGLLNLDTKMVGGRQRGDKEGRDFAVSGKK